MRKLPITKEKTLDIIIRLEGMVKLLMPIVTNLFHQ